MSLLRTQIREALLAKLSRLAHYRVLESPLYPLAPRDLPALTVSLEKETLVPDASTLSKDGVCVHTYELPVVVEGILQAAENMHRLLEDMALQVMGVIDDLTLGGLCKTLRWDSGIELVTSSEAEQPLGRLRLVGTVLYRVADNAPNTAYA